VKSAVSHGGQQLLRDGNYGTMQIWMEVNYLTTILSVFSFSVSPMVYILGGDNMNSFTFKEDE